MKTHHIVGAIFLVVVLLVFGGSCMNRGGNTYYQVPEATQAP